jgi:hypothetical protein
MLLHKMPEDTFCLSSNENNNGFLNLKTIIKQSGEGKNNELVRKKERKREKQNIENKLLSTEK